MSKKKAVVSLGHNALGYSTLEQWDAVKVTAKALADLVEADYQLTITHSNGPQISMIHKAMTELRRLYIDYTPAPMCVCSAMSQGYVGYDIQNSLKAELLGRGIGRTVSTILTRRIIAAPKPIEIVEIEAIRTLADAGQIVIACGGGGIPVIEQKHALKGASAVIEKDAIAGKLAADLHADQLIILTAVPNVYQHFGREDQTPIFSLTLSEAEEMMAEGEFEEGTMLPKIEAAITYLSANPNGSVLITSIESVTDALRGKAGTVITR